MHKMMCAVACALLPAVAQAETVVSGATRVGDVGGINAVGGSNPDGPFVSYSNPASSYSAEVTDPVSEWVWAGAWWSGASVYYEFEFDMTGYDLSTASLSGLWGVDNYAWVYLNGTEIGALPSLLTSNFTSLHDYGTSDASLFNAGANILRFVATDDGGHMGFRAAVVVTADPVSGDVPLPAGGVLLLAGLGVLAAYGAERRAR
ncbi:hypothetical protein RGUI_1889 [Rhodovulum sp. P5]|uniref:VPLPA-CTERM sorting domain-containing protein n=1 Tax=Rhodovulum sp. P5 TaxID=1564506 RepID=UPI0009C20853|nr:VPLPA-CTERM sorting domain-containing protein [Rhodovulum sp. P5]ARE40030.1 hypothetical protein RGUI_1889 [Rhodovulum sp. P5]